MILGQCAGNLLGLALSPVLLAKLGWRALFVIYGILGGPLLAMWLLAVPGTLKAGSTHAPGAACLSDSAIVIRSWWMCCRIKAAR